MKRGTRAADRLLDRYEPQHVTTLPDRILDTLARRGKGLGGYQIDRLQHSLQAATRAENDGADEEGVVAALIHDIGDDLAPMNHSALVAALIKPCVKEKVHWVVEHHGLFQMAYYAHHFGQNPNGRAHYKDHPFYESCLRFCERWDQASFDPVYPTQSLEYFSSLVRGIFSRQPFSDSGQEYSQI
jgi:predicted HD phosphohydrolase